VLAPLARRRAGEAEDGELGGVVGSQSGVAALGGEGDDVDDAAAARGEVGKRSLHRPQRRLRTGAPDEVELLVAHLLERRVRGVALGVVHQYVKLPELGDRLGDHPLDVGAQADVDDDPCGATTAGANRGDDALDAVLAQLGDDHFRALARIGERNALADSLPRAGDDGNLVPQPHGREASSGSKPEARRREMC